MKGGALNVCRRCGNEKIRFERGGRYRYRCHCVEWREYMNVLERARDAELRRPGRRPASARETVTAEPTVHERIPEVVVA